MQATGAELSEIDFASLRQRMVDEQLCGRRISDQRVLAAMTSVPRHLFVPAPERGSSYADGPLPIGNGQTISQPYMVARMTELLRLDPADRVLEVGTGSGYQAAILAELAGEVWTIERQPQLAERAGELLQQLGYTNLHVARGDGTLGLADGAPYDAIIVTAAAPAVPQALRDQLASGGRMVIPVTKGSVEDLRLIERGVAPGDKSKHPAWADDTGRVAGEFRDTSILSCIFVPLVGEDGYRQ